jgi:hypothetical protein
VSLQVRLLGRIPRGGPSRLAQSINSLNPDDGFVNGITSQFACSGNGRETDTTIHTPPPGCGVTGDRRPQRPDGQPPSTLKRSWLNTCIARCSVHPRLPDAPDARKLQFKYHSTSLATGQDAWEADDFTRRLFLISTTEVWTLESWPKFFPISISALSFWSAGESK